MEVRSAKDGALLASMAPEGGHRLHRIQFLRGSTEAVVFATEGPERLTLWNWKTGATISQYEEPTAFKTATEGRGPYARTVKTPIDHNTFDDFALLPDGKAVLAVSRNKGLRIWPLEQGKPMRQLAAFSGGTVLALTADGACAYVAHGEKIEAYDTASGQLLFQLPRNSKGVVSSLALSADGKRLMAADEADVTNHSVEIWDMETRQPFQRIPLTGGSYGTALPCKHICLSPDGRCVLAAVNQDVWLYRARDGMLLHHFPPERTPDGSKA